VHGAFKYWWKAGSSGFSSESSVISLDT